MNYKVYQGIELKQTVTSKTAVMNGLQPNKTYDFSVEADTRQANLLTGTSSDLQNAPDSQSSIAGGVLHQLSSNDLSILAANQVRASVFIHNTTTHTVNLVIWTNAGDFGVGTGVPAGTDGYSTITAYTSDPSVSRGDISIRAYTENAAISGVQYKDLKLEKVSVAKTSVTTRGIRFNIPKTLTVGSTIALRYEEYPLGIIPIGNEPAGYFGGGNRQNLSAKVISTANGSSVVEVAGNVIEVGNKNLIKMANTTAGYVDTSGNVSDADDTLERVTDFIEVEPNQTYLMQDKVNLVSGQYPWFCVGIYDGDKAFISRPTFYGSNTTDNVTVFNTLKIVMPNNAKYVRVSSSTYGNGSFKFEFGDQVTPYASFVDGDTFTAQPDGTYALFSEHKALYY